MAESKPSKKEAAFGDAKGRGNAAVQAADWWLAVECYTEALKAAPSTHFEPEGPAAAVLSNRSLAHLKCGLFEKALQDANDCIKMRPDWSKAHFRRGDIFRHLGKWRQAEVNFRMAYSIDPLDRHLADMLSEVTAKASLAASPDEYLLPIEWKVGLTEGTVWSGRCGLVGFLICFVLAILQKEHTDTSNPIFNFMLALGGLGLGAGVGLFVRMIRASKRRELLAPPPLPVLPARRGAGGGPGGGYAAGDVEGDEGDYPEEARRKRVKGLSKSLRNRAGR